MNNNKNNTGNYNSGYYNSVYCNSADYNSGKYNSGYYNSGDKNSGNRNSGKYNSGNCNSGYANSGYANSGDWNSGCYNYGDRNSGMFNTNEPFMRCFNKDTDIRYSDYDNFPCCKDFEVSYFIHEEQMTDAEKIDNPTYINIGGYIKEVEYKEAWKIFWRRTPENNKQKFLDLPNFDAEIFEEITGINVNKKEEEIEIEGNKFSLEEVKEALKNHTQFKNEER